MKIKLTFLAVVWLCFCLSCGLRAQSIFDRIPQKSDFAVYVHTDALFAHPALNRICQSGDIKRLKSDLDFIPWIVPSGKTLPDVIYTFYSDSGNYALLLDSGCTIDVLEKRLRKKYAKRKDIEIKCGKKNGIPMIRVVYIRDPEDYRYYMIAYVGQTQVMCTNYRNSMQWNAISGPYSKQSGNALSNLKLTDIACGYSQEPSRIKFDPTGIMRRVQMLKFDFTSDAKGGITFTGRFLCSDSVPEGMDRMAKQIRSLSQILFVFFFSADQELFRKLNENFLVQCEGNTVVCRTSLSADMIQEIRRYYESHEKEMSEGLKEKFSVKQNGK